MYEIYLYRQASMVEMCLYSQTGLNRFCQESLPGLEIGIPCVDLAEVVGQPVLTHLQLLMTCPWVPCVSRPPLFLFPIV